ncbi:hypothetical protein E2I00_008982, partial [Balaenoptera physalus]
PRPDPGSDLRYVGGTSIHSPVKSGESTLYLALISTKGMDQKLWQQSQSLGWTQGEAVPSGARTKQVLGPDEATGQRHIGEPQGAKLHHSSLCHTASFFGENHLEVPVAMALTDIDLQLEFSTSQPEALLLLAAGPADYLLLQLHSGRLQVRFILGQEEVRMQTLAETLLSDSIPHTVGLTVSDSWALLSVDGLLNVSAQVQQAPLEVPYGLFLGGTGNLGLPYLSRASRPLRGCLHTATLNGRSLLRPLTPDVPEGCAEEFSAGDDVPMGFSGPHSLAAFPAWGTRDEGTLDVPVADGQPHEVSVHVDAHRLEISVDQYPTRTSNRGVLSYLEPRGSLLLGGLDAEGSRHLREHRLGLAVNVSLLGCLEDLSINGQRWGLREALLTRSMAAGCRLEEDEYEEDAYGPYEAFSTLAPEAWPAMELPEPCAPEPGLPPIFDNFTQLLTVRPLVVAEGGTAWLEWRHVQPTLDLSEAELRKSQVLFSVSRGARHGELELDIPGAQARKMFTLLDVVNRKARFVHDGSEDTSDQLVLEVSVTARGPVPSCLRRGQTYILPIQINPVNDPPRVVFPQGSLMVILEHTQKLLGPEVFQADDPDSACEGLTFQLLGVPAGLPVERQDQPGEPATEFSCRELDAGSLRATVWLLRLEPLHPQNAQQEAITTAHLEATLEEAGPNPTTFHYEVVQAPRKGNLQLQGTRLSDGQSFTQDDLRTGRLTYGATARASEAVEDSFRFRGGEGVLSADHLFVKSLNSASYLYEVMERPRHGRLVWQGAQDSVTVVTSFTNEDLLHGRLVYQHDDSETTEDDIPFVATRQGEGSGDMAGEEVRGVFRVAIQPVNDHAPVQTISRVFHVARGGQRLLTTDDMAFSDADSGFADAQLVLTRKDLLFGSIVAASEPYLRVANGSSLVVPQGGQGTIDTAVLHLDTNLDIRGGDEVHYHVTAGPRWGRLLRGGQPAGPVHTDAALQVTIALEGPLAPLHLVQNKKIYVFQGEAAEIRRDQLEAAQEAVPPADIVFSVKTPPSSGHLVMLSHSATAAEPPSLDPVHSFSQEAVDAGRVLYLHSRPEAWSDVFSLDVSSGLGAPLEGVHVELEVLPAAIPLEALNFSVPEGGTRTLAPPLLRITGPYFPTLPGLELQVLEPPQHGVLQREEGPQDRTLSTFSWREVEQQLILYVHDGSETLADSFVLVANASEMDRQSHPVTFTITVLPVNDQPPVLTTNTGLQMWEGTTVPIPPEALRGTDSDSGPEDLVYTLEEPSNGQVVLRTEPGAEVHSFTQAQLDGGLVLFSHRGALDGGFRFILSDGEHTSTGHFFRVTAQKQLLLSLEGSRTLTICPGIDPHHLFYRVVRGPRLGRLFHTQQGSSGEALENFTQAEVYAGNVLYEHEMPPEPFWEADDALELRLSSPPAPDMAATLAVTRAEITTAALDASNFLASVPAPQRSEHDVLFQITQFPQRGQLMVSEEPLHTGRPHFLQSELAAGQLVYTHGGGGTQQDGFRFRAHLQGPAGASVAGPQTSEAFAITVRDLSVVDPDSAPGEIEYKVQRAPHNGFLSLAGASPGPVTCFTQADVDAGRLDFVANGSSVVGIFQLSVSDGASPPLPMSLAVDVLPSAIEVQLRAPLEVPQALGRSSLSRQQLRVVSDREEADAAYRLTQGPQYGHLLVGGQPAEAFSQFQVDQGEVVFAFTSFSSSHDQFSILALARGANASATVNVTVRALLHVWTGGPWPQGATLRLDPTVLDAGELANRTGSVPRFRLLAGPRHGRVVRVPRARTEPRGGQLVEQFTQQDLEDGRLGLEVGRPEGSSPGPAGDSLTLELWARGVPPAVASLDFATEPYNAARPYRVALLSLPEAARTEAGKLGSSTPTDEPGLAASSPVPTVARGHFLGFLEANMFSIIVPVCLVLLLLALIVPLLFYLRKRNKTGKHDVQVLTAKPRNGLAGDTETFRKMEPGQAIPLTAVPGQGAPPGGQPDPELLQFCRTSNPALKNGQYWV